MNNYPAGMSHSDLIFVGEIDDNFDDDAFEQWREDQFDENFEDICSNLGIEIKDVEQLRKDEALREIIIEKHDKQYPNTFTIEEYLETLGE